MASGETAVDFGLLGVLGREVGLEVVEVVDVGRILFSQRERFLEEAALNVVEETADRGDEPNVYETVEGPFEHSLL